MDKDLSSSTNTTRNLLDSEFTATFFDTSSKAWMENKVRNGYQVLYRCAFIYSNLQRCKGPCSASTSEYCLKHKRMRKQHKVKAEKKELAEKTRYNLRARNISITYK